MEDARREKVWKQTTLKGRGGLRGKGSRRNYQEDVKFCRLFFAKIKHLLYHPVPL